MHQVAKKGNRDVTYNTHEIHQRANDNIADQINKQFCGHKQNYQSTIKYMRTHQHMLTSFRTEECARGWPNRN